MVKVSVAMLAYNHEKYIEQAVRSALMQQTDFDYEIVIGEDCSTDATREILLRLRDEYPDKIRLMLHEENRGMSRNCKAIWDSCRGTYITWLEGDDFWLSPHKLQRQVDFLDTSPNCDICFHDVEEVYEDVEKIRFQSLHDCEEIRAYSIDDLLREKIYIPTPSVMMRNIDRLPPWFVRLEAFGDYAVYMWLLLSTNGMAILLPGQPMAAYRYHSQGVSNQIQRSKYIQFRLNEARDWYLILDHLPFDFTQARIIRRKAFGGFNEVILYYDRLGDPRRARAIFEQNILGIRWLEHYSKRFVFGLLLKLYFPALYERLEFLRRLVRVA